jgi:hypothetical protein
MSRLFSRSEDVDQAAAESVSVLETRVGDAARHTGTNWVALGLFLLIPRERRLNFCLRCLESIRHASFRVKSGGSLLEGATEYVL